ncbi:MAG: DEAD/DEAH box helicase family protein [Hyphomicrobiales bacterium]|nr:DEAD/DEAH box helicase family protein [Hyphomicrobiales bacterium]
MSYYQQLELDLSDHRLAALRPGQRGAIHSLRGYTLSRSDKAALVSLPTGYGKSEIIAIAPAIFRARRTLVIAPSRIVRDMLGERIKDQQFLRKSGIIDASVPKPSVATQSQRIDTTAAWHNLASADVVVAHPQALSPRSEAIPAPPDAELFDLIVFDEAHHLAAQTWSALLAAFPNAEAVGFSATPFRRDRLPLPGRVIFDYPLHRAVDDGLFAPITYQSVPSDQDLPARDRAVAEAAIAEHQHRSQAHPDVARLLVRADTIDRAEELAQLYRSIDSSITLELVTFKTPAKQLAAIEERLRAGRSDGVAFVGVLGEGFDLPSLKIAAYHNPHRSLPVTIQFAGRIARTGDVDEPGLLLAAAASHPEIVAELHRDNQRWDLVIDGLAADFQTQPTRLWSAPEVDPSAMIDAFTEENFRTYGLAQAAALEQTPDLSDLPSYVDIDHCFFVEGSEGRDEARVLALIERPDIATYALLIERRHDLTWLRATPDNYAENDHLVFSVVDRSQGGHWLFVRSTLPEKLTSAVLDELIGDREPPSGVALAQFEAQLFATGDYTALGQRSAHPATAGVKTYETGAGRSVQQSVTPDDQVLTAAGHAIAVSSAPGERRQVGVAFESHKVWRHGYLNLDQYHSLGVDIADALDNGAVDARVAGLRVPGGQLDASALPIAAEMDLALDPHGSAQLVTDGGTYELRRIEILARRPKSGGEILLLLKIPGRRTPVSTITIDPNGTPLTADGDIAREGATEPMLTALLHAPPSVFFNDGSFLRGAGGHVAAPEHSADYLRVANSVPKLDSEPYRALSEANQVLTVDSTTAALPEKSSKKLVEILANAANINAAAPSSLLQFASQCAVAEGADFVYCDDASGEMADLILGWRQYGLRSSPHVRLVHCKAKGLKKGQPKTAGASVIAIQEVAQQVLRSVGFLLSPADVVVSHITERASDHPSRFIVGDTAVLDEILSADPIQRSNEIWVLHPGISAAALRKSTGRNARTLLGSLRARLRSARINFAVVASP